MKARDVIRELETLCGCKWQVAKSIADLAKLPPGTVRQIGPYGVAGRGSSGPRKLPMTQENAAKLVAAARERIALVDEGD